MKMTHKFFALPVLMGALLIAGTTQNAHAAPDNTADVQVTLNVDPIAEIAVTSSAPTLTPLRSDYVAGYVEQTQAVSLNVFSNTPYVVTVEGQTGTPSLASTDLLARKNGTTTYAAVSGSVIIQNSASSSIATGDPIDVDLRVNLANTSAYAPEGTHTNNITFTVAPAAD